MYNLQSINPVQWQAMIDAIGSGGISDDKWQELIYAITQGGGGGITDTQIQALVTAIEKAKSVTVSGSVSSVNSGTITNTQNSTQWDNLVNSILGIDASGITDTQIQSLVTAIEKAKSVTVSGSVSAVNSGTITNTHNSTQWDDLVNSILGIDVSGITDAQIQSLVTAITSNKNVTTTHNSTQWQSLITAIENGGGSSINVVDNLTSTSTTDALSANQGRVLKGYIGDVSEIAQIGDGTVSNAISELNSTLTPQETSILNNKVFLTKIGKVVYVEFYGVDVMTIDNTVLIPSGYRPKRSAIYGPLVAYLAENNTYIATLDIGINGVVNFHAQSTISGRSPFTSHHLIYGVISYIAN